MALACGAFATASVGLALAYGAGERKKIPPPFEFFRREGGKGKKSRKKAHKIETSPSLSLSPK
jgi:hypothetical protein